MPELLKDVVPAEAGSGYGKRLGQLEQNVTKLSEVTAQLAKGLERLDVNMDRLASTVIAGQRPQWQTWAAIGALFLTVAAYVFGPYSKRQDDNVALIREIEHRADGLEQSVAVHGAVQDVLREYAARNETRLYDLEIDGAHHHALRERMDESLREIERRLFNTTTP